MIFTKIPFGIFKNDAILLLAASIWGFAFVAQRVGMRFIGPFTFNGIRFALGSLTLLPLWQLRKNKQNSQTQPGGEKETLKLFVYGLIAGVILFAASSFQQIGIIYTTAGKAGFITGLYVVLVPLTGLLWKQKPGFIRWVGAILAVTGLYFLSVTKQFTIERGDFLVFISALFWAAHVQAIGKLSPRTDPIKLATVQFGVCSAFSLATAILFENIEFSAIIQAAIPLLYGGLLSVGIAFTLQVVAQKTAHPTHAAIIMSLESLFAVLGGWLILGETLSPRNILGCSLMFLGMILAQLTLVSRVRKIRQADSNLR